jgi:tetratricopeptide (TPR) repeat protein
MLQLLLTVVMFLWAESSVLAGDEKDCFQGHEPQLRIKSCSEIIQRSPNDATAYHNRAFAYELAGDLDNALADYSKVIALAPSDASAYVDRGRAYTSKGDNIHAIQDETKAHDLIAKAAMQPPIQTPKAGKVRQRAAVKVTKSITTSQQKRILKPSDKVRRKAPSSDPWAWLFGNASEQAGGNGIR